MTMLSEVNSSLGYQIKKTNKKVASAEKALAKAQARLAAKADAKAVRDLCFTVAYAIDKL